MWYIKFYYVKMYSLLGCNDGGVMMVGGAYRAEVSLVDASPNSPFKRFPVKLYSWLPPNSSGWLNGMWSMCGLFTLLERLCRSHRRPGVVMCVSVWRHIAWPSCRTLLMWFSQFCTLYIKFLFSCYYIDAIYQGKNSIMLTILGVLDVHKVWVSINYYK